MQSRSPVALVAAALYAVCPVASAADVALKPGLYRVVTTVQSPDSGEPVATTDEECLTADVARDIRKLLQATLEASEEGCEPTEVKTVGDKMTFRMHCKDVVGEVTDTHGTMTFGGGDSYAVNVTTQMGRETYTVRSDAKWIRGGCAADE